MSHNTLAPEVGYHRGVPAVHVGTTAYEIRFADDPMFPRSGNGIFQLTNTDRFVPTVGAVQYVVGSPRTVFKHAWRWARTRARQAFEAAGCIKEAA